jgi:mRNA interferase RelE/StbE
MSGALYGLSFSAQSLAYLKTIQTKFRKQIIAKIQALPNDPIPPNSRLVQNRTDGDAKVHRIRSGVYRVLYSVRTNPDEIVILDIDHRKDVYR